MIRIPVSTKLIRKTLRVHATQGLLNICSVKAHRILFSNLIVIKIETHCPGTLIGKGGEHINMLKKFLEINLQEINPQAKVYIHLVESQLFSGDIWE